MADCDQDGKAGDSCTVCETPPKCFQQYTVTDSNKKVILDFPKTHNTKMSFITILQSNKSEIYKFSLKGSCQNGSDVCPLTYTPDREDLFGTDQKNSVMCYSNDYNWSNMTLLQWLKEFLIFDTKQLSRNHYILPVNECKGLVHIANLFVYPTYKLSIKFTYGKEISTAKIEDRQHLYEYREEELEKLRKEVGKPWSQINKQLVKVDQVNGLTGEAKIGEFDENLTYTFKENECYSDDNPIFKITSLISKISDSLMSEKGHIGPVRDITIFGPNVEINGIKELKQNGDSIYFEYSMSLGFAPLIGIKAIVDLVEVALQAGNAIFPYLGYAAAKSWHQLRTAMENSKKNYEKNQGKGGYIVAGVDLILTGEFGNCSVTIHNDANNKPAGRGEGGAKLTAEVVGYVKGEGKIWIVKGSISASISANTSIGGAILIDHQGIATRWEHDGAQIVFKAELVAEVRGRRKRKASYTMKPIIVPLADPYQSKPYYIHEFNS